MTNENVGKKIMKKNVNDRPPNFRNKNGELYLVRCFICEPSRGRENWAMAVSSGQCTWCGWREKADEISSRN